MLKILHRPVPKYLKSSEMHLTYQKIFFMLDISRYLTSILYGIINDDTRADLGGGSACSIVPFVFVRPRRP